LDKVLVKEDLNKPVIYARSSSVSNKWITDFGYKQGWSVNKHIRKSADVNGDGMADIVTFGDNSVFVSLSTGTGFQLKKTWSTDFGYNDNWRVEEHVRTMGDVNGDGKADIIAFGSNSVFVSLSTGIGFQSKRTWSSDFGYNDNWRNWKHVRSLADVNGDGKADIVAFGSNSIYVSLSTGRGFQNKVRWNTDLCYNDSWRVNKHVRKLSDVNGDGKSDIVSFGNKSTFVSLSTGNGFSRKTTWNTDFGFDDNWKNDKHVRTLADVNGDGKNDIVAFGSNKVYVSLSNGIKFQPKLIWVSNNYVYNQNWIVKSDNQYENGDGNPRMSKDVDGNGKSDIVGFGDYGVWITNSIF
jgi:hypothetical protein